MKKVNFEVLKNEYQGLADKAERLMESLVEQIGRLFSNNNLTLGVPIESRVKPWSSIEDKIQRKSLDIKSVTQLPDLVGIRTILLFRRDLTVAGDLLCSTFSVMSSEDIGMRLPEAQFGYQSRHYIVQLPKAWLAIPSFSQLGGLLSEIQVRTLAQHIWAAASHKLQYKHEESVPQPIRRTIYRVSALLETVDLEFERVLEERQHYIERDTIALQPTEPLNVDLVESILSELLPEENKEQPEEYAELLTDLSHFKIHTASDLRALIQANLDAIIEEDQSKVRTASGDGKYYYDDPDGERIHRGVYFTHVGLVRTALEKAFGYDVVRRYMKRQYSPSSAGEAWSLEQFGRS